jgi:hypothetical protein
MPGETQKQISVNAGTRHHRHKRFHVPEAAKGIGYDRFQATPGGCWFSKRPRVRPNEAEVAAIATSHRIAILGICLCLGVLLGLVMWLFPHEWSAVCRRVFGG